MILEGRTLYLVVCMYVCMYGWMFPCMYGYVHTSDIYILEWPHCGVYLFTYTATYPLKSNSKFSCGRISYHILEYVGGISHRYIHT